MVTSLAFLYIITYMSFPSVVFRNISIGLYETFIDRTEKMDHMDYGLTRFSGNEAGKIHFLMHFLLPLKKMTRIITLER